MFLLILEEEYKEYHALNFTFHYVSINTMCIWILPDGYRTLHSTMFLLILTKTLHKELNIFLYIPLCFY